MTNSTMSASFKSLEHANAVATACHSSSRKPGLADGKKRDSNRRRSGHSVWPKKFRPRKPRPSSRARRTSRLTLLPGEIRHGQLREPRPWPNFRGPQDYTRGGRALGRAYRLRLTILYSRSLSASTPRTSFCRSRPASSGAARASRRPVSMLGQVMPPRIDVVYLRPIEVDLLVCDSSKACEKRTGIRIRRSSISSRKSRQQFSRSQGTSGQLAKITPDWICYGKTASIQDSAVESVGLLGNSERFILCDALAG